MFFAKPALNRVHHLVRRPRTSSGVGRGADKGGCFDGAIRPASSCRQALNSDSYRAFAPDGTFGNASMILMRPTELFMLPLNAWVLFSKP